MLQVGTLFLLELTENDHTSYEVVHAFDGPDGKDCLVIRYHGAINADPGTMMVLETTGDPGQWWLDGEVLTLTEFADGGGWPILSAVE